MLYSFLDLNAPNIPNTMSNDPPPEREDLDQFLDALEQQTKEDPPASSPPLESPYMSSSPTRNERKSINKEIPKAAVGKQLKSTVRSKMLDRSNKIPLRKTPAKSSRPTSSVSPRALTAPIPTRGGLTMYERSMLAIESRDRKLKVLQAKLEEDHTFTPNSKRKNYSGSHSVDGSPPKAPTTSVYDRLYDARKAPSPRRTDRGGPASPPAISRSRSADSARSRTSTTSSRLVEMHERGQELLRRRGLNSKQEDEMRRRRLEEEELANCTFTPKTKWNLAQERREKAKSNKASPMPDINTREKDEARKRRLFEEEELRKCTFTPNTKWNIAKERREKARAMGVSPLPPSTSDKKKRLSVSLNFFQIWLLNISMSFVLHLGIHCYLKQFYLKTNRTVSGDKECSRILSSSNVLSRLR